MAGNFAQQGVMRCAGVPAWPAAHRAQDMKTGATSHTPER
jgi:hypothetical protein